MSLPLVLSGNSADPRLPKRQRQRDEDPPDAPTLNNRIPASEMDCDSPTTTRTIVSYKDIVTGSGESPQDSVLFDLDDDDIDLLEEDIAIGSMNGVPTIDFSERVRNLAIKSMDLTLVVKVLGRRIGYNTFQNRIYGIWKPFHPIKLIDIENDFFLVKFSDRDDYMKVLTDGPWTIFGHYLTVEQWSTDFQPTQASPSRLMAWIRLPGLPLTLYKRSFIEAIGNQIGSMIKIDSQTDNGCRGRFARLAVSLNLHRPLVSKLIINGRTQVVEYESLPAVCFNCGVYGHLKDICPKLQNSDPLTSVHPDAPPPIPPSTLPTPAEDFGPWMLVEKRKRNHKSSAANRVLPSSQVAQSIPPITNPIFVESDNLRDSLPESREPAVNSATLVNDRPVIQEASLAIVSDSTVTVPDPPNHISQGNKGSTIGKSANSANTGVSLSKKSSIVGVRFMKQSHATSKPPAHGPRMTLLQQAPSSSRPPRVPAHRTSKSVVSLDPSKHHAIHISDATNPSLPMEAATGSISHQNHENMVE
ncbi:hypothetical protein GQ457_05G002760 [Hibiscus cannabinus]